MCARVFECVGVFVWIGVAYSSKKALSWCVYMCIWVCICVCGCERVCVWLRVFYAYLLKKSLVFICLCTRVHVFVSLCVYVCTCL